MITNMRLMELRGTGTMCQARVDLGTATLLEKDHAELFQLVLDGVLTERLDSHARRVDSPHLSILIGK